MTELLHVAMSINSIRLQCDAVSCDYHEMISVITADIVNKPCPKCGQNLLTEEDYIAAKQFECLTQAINDLNPIPPDAPKKHINRMYVSANPRSESLNINFSDKPPPEAAE